MVVVKNACDVDCLSRQASSGPKRPRAFLGRSHCCTRVCHTCVNSRLLCKKPSYITRTFHHLRILDVDGRPGLRELIKSIFATARFVWLGCDFRFLASKHYLALDEAALVDAQSYSSMADHAINIPCRYVIQGFASALFQFSRSERVRLDQSGCEIVVYRFYASHLYAA
jgi:hypothetical protein